jgi:hypothetical protein
MPLGLVLDSDNVYWYSPGANDRDWAIARVGKGGGEVTIVAAKQHHTSALALGDTYVYWANSGRGDDDGTIWRVDKSGGKPELLARRLRLPSVLAVYGERVYWPKPGAIMGSTPGGGARPIVKTERPAYLAVDGEFFYWSEIRDTDWQHTPHSEIPPRRHGRILRKPKHGGESIVLADHEAQSSQYQGPYSFLVVRGDLIWNQGSDLHHHDGSRDVKTRLTDLIDRYAADGSYIYYFTSYGLGHTRQIRKIPYDGGTPVVLVDLEGEREVTGLAVDDAWVYWSSGDGRILKVPK